VGQAARRASPASRHARDRSAAAGRHPQHHFRFDAAKFLHYAHTTYAWLGMPEQTERYARQAIAAYADPASRNHWPSRVTTARLDLALALAERGSLDEAVTTGNDALAHANWMRRFQLDKATEVGATLRAAPGADLDEYQERLTLAKRSGERAHVDW
jgi:signal transduction histidine kinase